jgi:hypothetical protein
MVSSFFDKYYRVLFIKVSILFMDILKKQFVAVLNLRQWLLSITIMDDLAL